MLVYPLGLSVVIPCFWKDAVGNVLPEYQMGSQARTLFLGIPTIYLMPSPVPWDFETFWWGD